MRGARPIMGSLIALCIGFSVSSVLASDVTSQNHKQIPIAFTKNVGQWSGEVEYRTTSDGATVWICKDRIVYQFFRKVAGHPAGSSLFDGLESSPKERLLFNRDSTEQLVITARFVAPSPAAKTLGEELMEYKCNYFLGNDSTKWQTDVPNYGAVTLEGIYDGIDLHFFGGADGKLAYFFSAAPDSDPGQMELEYEGAIEVAIDVASRMTAQTEWGEITGILARPSDASLRLSGEDTNEGEHLSPTVDGLIYSTFLGGSSDDYGYEIVVDRGGCAYVGGYTLSMNFPAHMAYDASHSGGNDIFVTKFSSTGTSLVYSTYLGGSLDDYFGGLDLRDSSTTASAVVTGFTRSGNFPVLNAYDDSWNGSADVFVTRLSDAGNSLVFSTYLGGADDDLGADIHFSGGIFYVTGGTKSTNFPMANAYDMTHNGNWDAFVAQLNIVGGLYYSSYYGGSGDERANSVVFTYRPSPYQYLFHIAGWTNSTNLPTRYAYDSYLSGPTDGFVASFDFVNNQLFSSTYLGGVGEDYIESIYARYNFTSILVTGETASSDFPLGFAYDSTLDGPWDAFVTTLSDIFTPPMELSRSTYLGGSGNDYGFSIASKSSNSVEQPYLTGYTTSTDFPTRHALDPSYNGGPNDAFVTSMSFSSLSYSTYLGGSGNDAGFSATVDSSGYVYVTGETYSSNFPVQNAYDPSFNSGQRDAFDAKLANDFSNLYLCGDANGSGAVNISDAVYLINYIFADGPAPNPLQAGDANCSGGVNISDAVYIINYIFGGGPAPCAACP